MPGANAGTTTVSLNAPEASERAVPRVTPCRPGLASMLIGMDAFAFPFATKHSLAACDTVSRSPARTDSADTVSSGK